MTSGGHISDGKLEVYTRKLKNLTKQMISTNIGNLNMFLNKLLNMCLNKFRAS